MRSIYVRTMILVKMRLNKNAKCSCWKHSLQGKTTSRRDSCQLQVRQGRQSPQTTQPRIMQQLPPPPRLIEPIIPSSRMAGSWDGSIHFIYGGHCGGRGRFFFILFSFFADDYDLFVVFSWYLKHIVLLALFINSYWRGRGLFRLLQLLGRDASSLLVESLRRGEVVWFPSCLSCCIRRGGDLLVHLPVAVGV